jgi:cytoskeleton protein RodZ
VQRSTIGVGPTLRRARVARGVTLDEASRDTRIRREFLVALEEEDFERLLGDVYVRGSLRSYATYLGLPPDQMVQAYARFAAEPAEAPAPAGPPAPENPIDAPRRRDSHRLFVMIAATLLILAASFGIISTRGSAPPPADLSSDTPGLAGPAPRIVAVVAAEQPVRVTVTIDAAAPQTFSLQPGESRSFDADLSLTIRLDHGASAHLTVNGDDKGFPGRPNRPWRDTYSYEGAGPTPSPSA